MATITIRCPSTGIRVSTRIQTEAEVFKTLPHIQAVLSRCPACGLDHFWTTSMAEIVSRRPLRRLLRLGHGTTAEVIAMMPMMARPSY